MSTAPEPSAPQDDRASRRQSDQMAAPPKLRRRPMLIAVSVILTAVGALLTAYLLTAIAGTHEVVAVKEDISRGEKITAEHLQPANVSADGVINPIPWSSRSVIEGQYAAHDMAAGTLVARDSTTEELAVPAGQAMVGLFLEPGKMPSTGIRPGDQVRIVYSLDEDPAEKPDEYLGYVVNIEPAPDTRGTIVDVRVRSDDAPHVSQASSAGGISLVLNTRDKAEQDANATGEGWDISSQPQDVTTSGGSDD